jgi:hypothetical protein
MSGVPGPGDGPGHESSSSAMMRSTFGYVFFESLNVNTVSPSQCVRYCSTTSSVGGSPAAPSFFLLAGLRRPMTLPSANFRTATTDCSASSKLLARSCTYGSCCRGLSLGWTVSKGKRNWTYVPLPASLQILIVPPSFLDTPTI